MSDFTDQRAQLSGQRATREQKRRQLDEQRERLKAVNAEIETLSRGANADDQQRAKRLQDLTTEATTLAQQFDERRGDLAKFDADALQTLAGLAALADPAEQVEELSDAFPVLFFPLRIETRFKTLGGGASGAAQTQLWVRVYPDDCQVDAFEEMLSDFEVKSARLFWAGVWKSGGVEDQERGAWKTFVSSHGSGRAAWILKNYQPLGAPPTPKAKPEDIILVVVPEMELTQTQEDKACEFWVKFWKAGDNTAARVQARQDLDNDTDVGPVVAADIVKKFKPVNLGDEPPSPKTRADVKAACVKISFDPNQPPATKTTSWTRAPKARAMPDRLVLMCYQGGVEVKRVVGNPIPDQLATGPDPTLPEGEQMRMLDGELAVNEELRWMTDFERAVAVGMGFRVDLTPAEAGAGFQRLLVLGVRASADQEEARALLESLITDHYHSRHGFGLVPQGSPTNNTEGEGSGYTWTDDPDATFDTVFKGRTAFADSDDPFERRDGQWLATHLGIDTAVVRLAPHADGRDQGEARAMNTALWPATLGYMMEEMMTPLFSFDEADATHRFFSAHVSGRGPVPAVRVGRQPYGILPAMAFSRYQPTKGTQTPTIFVPPHSDSAYLSRLYSVLSKMDADWGLLAQAVAHVGEPGNPHQTLLDIIGLHSGSVEFHQRYAESLQHVFNELMMKYGPLLALLLASWLAERGTQLLGQLGVARPPDDMPILKKFFFGEATLLTGPVVDDVPLSESAAVRKYSADGKNYIEWLAASSTEKIRVQDFGGNPAPTALLYLMLRHAVMLGQWDAGVRLLAAHELADAAALRAEPAFINVAAQQKAAAAGSKFEPLYRAAPAVTGDPTTTIAEHILKPAVLATAFETRDLRGIIKALQSLSATPTARLERLFSEHLDCCSYRLDAWKTGLAAARLEEMRALPSPPVAAGAPAGTPPSKGIYLGAYGWLENVKSENKVLKPVPPLPAELGADFQKDGQPALVTDNKNQGYIHAPSLDHAATAAVLKNAYTVNASSANPEAMSVNLSSERVRRALTLLEGVRNGQSLSALLGYQFERGLHDRHGLVEVDKFIYPLRLAFPLVADKMQETKSDGATDVALMEARNVVDGLRLVKHIREQNNKHYPFGKPAGTQPGQLRPATPDEGAAIDAEIDAMLDLHDAAADLLLSESVYQTVKGNFDRAAASTQALGRAHYPPEPEVVITPRSGSALTHRVAVHLDAAALPGASPNPVAMTPRADVEPAVNAWLAAFLPAPADVVCAVYYRTPALVAEQRTVVSQEQIGLQPADLLYLLNLDMEQAMAELDARVEQFVRYEPTLAPHPAVEIRIAYSEHIDGQVSFFELAPLVKSLRALLLRGRHLSASDMALPVEAEAADYLYDFAEMEGRVDAAISAANNRHARLVALEADGSNLDDYAKLVSEEFLLSALHGLPQTGTGDIHDSIRAIYAALLAKIKELTARWDQKADDFNHALNVTFPPLATDAERLALLVEMEGLIASSTTAPTPTDVNAYKTAVLNLKATFDARLAGFKTLLTLDTARLVDFVADVDAAAALAADHDAVPLDIADQKAAVTSLRADIVARVTSLRQDVEARAAKAGQLRADSTSVADAEGRVRALLLAAAQVLGDEVRLLPRFVLPAEQAAEMQNCFANSAALLTHLKTQRGRLFPEDDWLYGLARVREKLREWENVVFLSEAFVGAAPALTPLQLPHRDGDSWLALEFPDGYAFDGDRLLYTPHFAAAFDPLAPQCGLFVDEWTEVIPGTQEVTGVAFHFDRPNSEPPQAMLLAVPPRLTGRWHWDDLVAMLHDTLDAARKRGVEPSQVDASNYAQFLPATLTAVTLYQMTIAVNLAFNNGIYNAIEVQ